MEYVQELQKFIPVDIYGKCGRLNFTDNGLNQGIVFGLLLPLALHEQLLHHVCTILARFLGVHTLKPTKCYPRFLGYY